MEIIKVEGITKIYRTTEVETTALENVNLTVKEGEFLSKTELRKRGGLSSTLVEKMDEMGILGNMPEDNQLSLFDELF